MGSCTLMSTGSLENGLWWVHLDCWPMNREAWLWNSDFGSNICQQFYMIKAPLSSRFNRHQDSPFTKCLRFYVTYVRYTVSQQQHTESCFWSLDFFWSISTLCSQRNFPTLKGSYLTEASPSRQSRYLQVNWLRTLITSAKSFLPRSITWLGV